MKVLSDRKPQDVLLLRLKEAADKELEAQSWEIVSRLLKESNSQVVPPMALRARYNALRDGSWRVGAAIAPRVLGDDGDNTAEKGEAGAVKEQGEGSD